MQWLKDFINSFFDKIVEIPLWFKDVFLKSISWFIEGLLKIVFWLVDLCLDILFWIFDTLVLFITTPLYWLYDGFLTIVSLLITSINLSALGFQTFAGWSGMPPQLIYIVNQLALPQCVTIIVGAMTVRLILNIIPAAFTRV